MGSSFFFVKKAAGARTSRSGATGAGLSIDWEEVTGKARKNAGAGPIGPSGGGVGGG